MNDSISFALSLNKDSKCLQTLLSLYWFLGVSVHTWHSTERLPMGVDSGTTWKHVLHRMLGSLGKHPFQLNRKLPWHWSNQTALKEILPSFVLLAWPVLFSPNFHHCSFHTGSSKSTNTHTSQFMRCIVTDSNMYITVSILTSWHIHRLYNTFINTE